ncbi:hypothetical protein N803_11335 [Knoellia subterranea KCTC 19937]|uniref:Uncharacterized protein n=1 Tax=Knoellia subterranea KCTC 19937 TaxID=1385521 RepID=A0A0A0JNM2_9MICO|nr:hypothetical protein N803_11335 [Knoellia subterranea KCTC 19937]
MSPSTEPSAGAPEDLAHTQALPFPERSPMAGPTVRTAPPTPPGPTAVGRKQSPSTGRGRIAAMFATFVVLTILGTWALTQLFGSNPAPTTDASGSQSTSTSAPPSAGSPSPTTPSETSSPSASSSATLPAGAPEPRLTDAPKLCNKSGSDAVASAWSGNRDTSCAFSEAVRAAYRKLDDTTGTFRTYSTVTKRWYDVTCLDADGAQRPLRCHSADGNAVVFLGP